MNTDGVRTVYSSTPPTAAITMFPLPAQMGEEDKKKKKKSKRKVEEAEVSTGHCALAVSSSRALAHRAPQQAAPNAENKRARIEASTTELKEKKKKDVRTSTAALV